MYAVAAQAANADQKDEDIMMNTTLAAALDAVRLEELRLGAGLHWADSTPVRAQAAAKVPADMSTASVDFWAGDGARGGATARAEGVRGAGSVAHWARA